MRIVAKLYKVWLRVEKAGDLLFINCQKMFSYSKHKVVHTRRLFPFVERVSSQTKSSIESSLKGKRRNVMMRRLL